MNSQSNDERRRSERLNTLNFVSYRDKNNIGQVISEGVARTLDLSLNGAMIELSAPLNNPKVAELEFALDDEVVCLPGFVIDQYQDSNGAHRLRVEFKNLKPSVLHKLQTYILASR